MTHWFTLAAVALASLSGCAPDYSPNTYNTTAVQQANKVEQGTVVGVRLVDVTSQGAAGAIVGGAAGGIVGAQTPGGGFGTAFGALGGSVIGGLIGTAAERTSAQTQAYEYIVRKGNAELVSVTQKDGTPLVLGQRVLVIAGSQARIVPDYTVQSDPQGARSAAQRELANNPPVAPTEPVVPAPPSVQAEPLAAPVPPAAEPEPLTLRL